MKTMENLSWLQGESVSIPINSTLHDYFDTKVRLHLNLARINGLTCQEQFIDYAEIQQKSKVVTRNLEKILHPQDGCSGGTPLDNIIAVDIQPCCKLIAVLLGILRAGAAFLPVDSHSAINRVKFILNEVMPACIVVDSTSVFAQDTDTVWSKYRVIDMEYLLDESLSSMEDPLGGDNDVCHGGEVLAAVIYTSGSTGNPKGVKLSHLTVMNRLSWQWNTLPFMENEVTCFKTSLLFVDSLVETFGSVLQLQPLVIAKKHIVRNPESLLDFLVLHRITRLTTVPSLLHNMLFYLSMSGRGPEIGHLHLLISNSETLRPELVQKFFDIFPSGTVLYNLFGSTETMADITYEVYRTVEDLNAKRFGDCLSIGRPMQNSALYIVDSNLELVPKGELGQIGVSGLNIAQGYIGQNGNHNSFLLNPFRDQDTYPVLYLTGDFGRICNDGVIYEGRRDLQVKIRGQRVNISEIEKVVSSSPFITWTHVLCHQFSNVSNVIVAYYKTCDQVKRTKAESDIMMRCQKDLPCYMRPKLVHINEVPLQHHSCKIDRLALRKLYEKTFNRQSSQELAVVDQKGKKVLNILALNLNLPTHALCSDKSFFEMGGNSVNMISTIVQLKQHDLHITIEEFSRSKTIQEIIDRITAGTEPVNEILQTERYIIQSLNQAKDSQRIIKVFAESFVEKEPLDVLLGVSLEEFQIFANSLYAAAHQSTLSLVVIDQDSGEIVGGDFLFDYHGGLQVQHHQSMAPILRLMKDFEDPIKERLRDRNPGPLLYNYCLCVDKDLPHAEQVRLCHLIEESVLKVAKQNGFQGVLTNNTNPVTQVSFYRHHAYV